MSAAHTVIREVGIYGNGIVTFASLGEMLTAIKTSAGNNITVLTHTFIVFGSVIVVMVITSLVGTVYCAEYLFAVRIFIYYYVRNKLVTIAVFSYNYRTYVFSCFAIIANLLYKAV